MKKKLGGLAAIAAIGFPLLSAESALGHGWTDSPMSRQGFCAEAGDVDDCGLIIYEPQSVEGPKNFPEAGPADGEICSAGIARFSELDDPRGGQWPATELQAGQELEFHWMLPANHATSTFRYFITADDYDPSQPLTRDQLDLLPFFTVDLGGEQPPQEISHTATLPEGKSGRHLILGVWDIADTPNAFYACSDVVFGEDTAPTPTTAPEPTTTTVQQPTTTIDVDAPDDGCPPKDDDES